MSVFRMKLVKLGLGHECISHVETFYPNTQEKHTFKMKIMNMGKKIGPNMLQAILNAFFKATQSLCLNIRTRFRARSEYWLSLSVFK
jgi:hypothetical protein